MKPQDRRRSQRYLSLTARPVALIVAASLVVAACSTASTGDQVAETIAPTTAEATATPSAAESESSPTTSVVGDEGESAEPETVPETTEAPTTDAPAGAPDDGVPPLFSGEYQTLSGETFDLGSLEGQDVVLWFWAPW